MFLEKAPSIEELTGGLGAESVSALQLLRSLLGRGLLSSRRRGRRHLFEPAPDLPERLRDLGA